MDKITIERQMLLPCPFCGDDGDKGRQEVTQMIEGRNKFARITCRACGAMCPEENWNRRAALAAQPDDNEWRTAIEDELICAHIGTADSFSDAQSALKSLIDWHVSVSLDPAVSSDAQALIDRGRAAQPAGAQQEPNMRHPKIQALIGNNARQHIWMMLVEQLVEDPHFETTAMDMEYWDTLHDKLKEKLTAAQPAEAQHCLVEGGYAELAARMRGRADYIRDQGGIKSAELMEQGADAITFLAAQPAEAQPTGQSPCARHCEAPAFEGEIRRLKREATIKDSLTIRPPAPAAVPLTDEQIDDICWNFNCSNTPLVEYDRLIARAIERAHGIAAAGDKP